MSPAYSSAPAPVRYTSAMLRRELSARNLELAEALSTIEEAGHEQTIGSVPSIVYAPHTSRRSHGNFIDASYRRIVADAAWCMRLEKAYTGSRRIARAHDRTGRAELDCANSSDALLMNIFCYPGVLVRPALLQLLGLETSVAAEFGVRLGVPLRAGKRGATGLDRTEIDLRLGNLLIEAKLTETDFQTAPVRLVERYRDLDEVFHVEELPRTAAGGFAGYQLLRGALAAQANDARFAVLCDARRVDLAEQWFAVLRAVRSGALRSRLQLVTWQELAATVSCRLQQFLSAKYGIVAA